MANFHESFKVKVAKHSIVASATHRETRDLNNSKNIHSNNNIIKYMQEQRIRFRKNRMKDSYAALKITTERRTSLMLVLSMHLWFKLKDEQTINMNK